MKLLILFTTLQVCLFSSCFSHKEKTHPVYDKVIEQLKAEQTVVMKKIAKAKADFPMSYEISLFNAAKNCDLLFYDFDTTLKKIESGELKLPSKRALDDMFKALVQQVKDTIQKEIHAPQLPIILGTADDIKTNRLILWSYALACTKHLYNMIPATCGVFTNTELQSTLKNTVVKTGEPIVFMSQWGDFEYPLKAGHLDSITCDNRKITIPKLHGSFNNQVQEFIPTQAGKYVLYLSYTNKRVSGKLEQYNSELHLTVLP